MAYADAADGEAEGGTTVLGEDIGDEDDALAFLAGEIVVDHEVERRRAPKGTPPAGDGLGADAVLGGEERDDCAKDGVGEAADEIEVGSIAGAAAPW